MAFSLRNDRLVARPDLTAPVARDGKGTAAQTQRTSAAGCRAGTALERKAGAPAIRKRPEGAVRDDEQLSALIGEIYDAAIEPARWAGMLARTADFVGGMSAALCYKDAATKQGNVYYECGRSDPRYKRLYFESYIKIDPTSVGLGFRDVGTPLGVADILDVDEFRASRFYQEWVRPQRWADAMSVALSKTGTGAALFTVFRLERHGMVDASARQRMGLIAPHVRRAALIGRAIEHKTAEAATLADTLDGLGTAMFLLDADARIVHANAPGEVMLREGFVLRTAAGKLAAADGRTTHALIEAITAAKGGDAALGKRGIAVPLTGRDGERYVAHTLPLTSAARRGAGAQYAAVAALFVQKAVLGTRSAAEVIARTFSITPTELRVLLAIVETGGVPETACALGVGQATVKTHLHRLFCKTATGRQAELVKLVAAFSSPLVN